MTICMELTWLDAGKVTDTQEFTFNSQEERDEFAENLFRSSTFVSECDFEEVPDQCNGFMLEESVA